LDISFTKEQEEYRQQARKWLQENIPKNWTHNQFRLSEEEQERIMSEWDRTVYHGGYSGISWPKEYGGQGLSLVEEIIFEEESGKLNAPKGHSFIGKVLLGPTLLKYGTEEQKQRFLPPLIKAEEIWCQGFSEPNAGSDLGGLSMKATLDGDYWVLNGQKIWTSVAQYAHWCFALARTDSDKPKHKGITYFLIPMNIEGITVKPIKKISGEKDFNEVFFSNVKILKNHFVGELNDGWNVAMGTLSFERGVMPLGRQSRFENEFKHLCELSEKLTNERGIALKDDEYFSQKLAQLYMELKIMRYHGLKIISKFLNTNKLGPEVSMMKVFWTEMHTSLGQLALEMLNTQTYGISEHTDELKRFQNIYLTAKGENIYAGTNQIQRNIVAEKVLGMPR
jgi:alkylation response protein AidB-like acyl-CoA dehydrogenase